MNVLITGGTGTLGVSLVAAAEAAGHTVRVMSRRPRSETEKKASETAEWVRADLATGEGVADAVAGVDAVLHAATSPQSNTEAVDVDGTRRLVRAGDEAGVAHFVYPSIVGVDAIPLSYYRHKREAERIVERGDGPHTVLRATQFHTFVASICSVPADRTGRTSWSLPSAPI